MKQKLLFNEAHKVACEKEKISKKELIEIILPDKPYKNARQLVEYYKKGCRKIPVTVVKRLSEFTGIDKNNLIILVFTEEELSLMVANKFTNVNQ